ncbi:fimbria/pilus outer membrane usher protein [Citrobacter freundii]|uniref:fimbria/pilus outer membrane usher protein n=1 Tax=Citrobacter freundii TaxID=546 RepID=UPI00289D680E|nr:fimbria/pilus outer membrane usher protein [Citrobacter freundii]
MNTSIGAFSFDVTHSEATADDVGTKGQSYSLNYSKNFTATRTTFSVVGYRFPLNFHCR